MFVYFYSCKMGSSFSVTNDTDDDIWVWNGANYEAIIGAVGAVVTVASLGIATAG